MLTFYVPYLAHLGLDLLSWQIKRVPFKLPLYIGGSPILCSLSPQHGSQSSISQPSLQLKIGR